MPLEYSLLLAELKDALTRQRYSRVAIHNYCRNAGYFLAYLEARPWFGASDSALVKVALVG
jgi:hypothetical protein